MLGQRPILWGIFTILNLEKWFRGYMVGGFIEREKEARAVTPLLLVKFADFLSPFSFLT